MAKKSIYNPKEIEAKWLDEWVQNKTYLSKQSEGKEKAYVLGMFPYPSGDGLHTGHVRMFTACDVLGRYLRMKGKNVLLPMGWDAFGLPAENAAIKKKVNPKEMVPENEANFKRQMQLVGLSYDWEREFSTTDPEYYKWTQWLFLKLYSLKDKNGKRLVEKRVVPINWCPFCKTGLANEEVLSDGTHERCGKSVQQRSMNQWVMRITEYAEELLTDLKGLDWPKGILEMQKNWIGKREGAKVKFQITNSKLQLEVFTTRLDTIAGVTFLVVSPEVALDWDLSAEAKEYVQRALNTPELKRKEKVEKTGVKTNRIAINPITGEKVEVWVADYVLGSVGTGVVMGVPAHDERDLEFAQKYNLGVKTVVQVEKQDNLGRDPHRQKGKMLRPEGFLLGSHPEHIEAFVDDGVLVDSGKYTGLTSAKAREEMSDDLENQGKAQKMVDYHLRDWIFSRQRYWGEPFPLVYCDKCGDENGVVVLTEADLPLELPDLDRYEPTETGESPLSMVSDWVETKCPKCGGKARRETDTMPNWAGSCWYFLHFALQSNKQFTNNKSQTDESAVHYKNMSEEWEKRFKPAIKYWLPVDWYLGGAEHAVLHLLYARFWVKAFKDLGLVEIDEPFKRLRSVGMVLAEDGRKMSKSWGNVINPDEMVERFGADTLRVYEMFMGPWDQAIAWETRSMVGCYRFLERIWTCFEKESQKSDPDLVVKLNKIVVQIDKDLAKLKFNTAVAAMMKFVNEWKKSKAGLVKEEKKIFLKLLAPIAPFMSEELWCGLGEKESIHLSSYPEIKQVEIETKVNFVVQVDGKMRLVMENVAIEEAHDRSVIQKKALLDERVAKWVSKKASKNVIFVPGKLINFVTE